ncbi:growth/differentiatio [Misgurnus anguillicaudatus]|uniref:growth/differentiatio n=1 Tax=Misgurnus anguillicaudatus TaxID=75329 RepID=UPI003CCFC5F6
MATTLLKSDALYSLTRRLIILTAIGLSCTSCYFLENASLGPDVSLHHGNILNPLLKALSEQNPWGDFTPRTKPDSRYVRYMKRLYKLSSKHDRSHEASHLYNTVRLITPREECLQRSREFMQDISYSLNRVRSQEQLLKSVLLYSFDHNHIAPFTSLCYLDVMEQEPSKDHMCSDHLKSHHAVPLLSFRVHTERRVRRRWVEVDVTSFLHPIIQAHKKDIHLLINLTCIEDMIPRPGGQIHKSPVELTHRSPSLLLYLNDTSEVAYQRKATGNRMVDLTSNHWDGKSRSWKTTSRKRRGTLRSTSVPKAGPDSSSSDLVPMYDFPTDDCDLYDFRVSFNQLKLDHWIIAPHKYNPRYCKGSCPRAVGYIYGSPVHTMVQNIIYEKLDSSVPRPSCVPSEYNPLSVLTIENDGSIAYKEYEEMIATKCTCR